MNPGGPTFGGPPARAASSRANFRRSDVSNAARGRSVEGVPSYLVETYLARGDAGGRAARERRARSVAAELTRQGTRIRFDRTIHLPEDEICFFVFDAPSGSDAALAAAARRARPAARRRSHLVRRGRPVMRIRFGLAATLALVVVLALGSTGTSAAPQHAASTENAVVYWSGVAASAIVVGRAPASSAVLGGMVHGAMYDAVAAVEGGLEPFATGVTAPPGASADAAVAQAARDVLVARVPGQAAAVQTAYDTYMASIPAGPAKDGGQGCRRGRGGRHARDADRRSLRRRRSVRPAAAGPGRVRADRADAACRPEARSSCARSPTPRRPTTGRARPIELTSKRYAEDVAELQTYGRVDSTVRTRAADRDRPLPHRADLRPVQPHPA